MRKCVKYIFSGLFSEVKVPHNCCSVPSYAGRQKVEHKPANDEEVKKPL
jgi:hypothetical protein